MIRLRSFEKGDLAHLHELDQICFPPGISYSIAELKYFLVSRRCSCWIAEDTAEDPELKLAGFIIVERLRRASRNARSHRHHRRLPSDPPAWRRQAPDTSRGGANETRGSEPADVGSGGGQRRSEGVLLVRMGFSRIGRIPDYYPGKLDADVMAKVI